jgi:hypothetical protein
MVLKKKRGLSKLEFYHNVRKMRKELTMLVLRDFGIHSRGAKFKADTGSQQPEGFYDELIADFSRNIRNLLRNLVMNITAANTIYPVNNDELQTRRGYQTAAIINCEQLLQELLYIQDVLPVKASKFVPYIEQIEFEVSLLKGWRKANNKIVDLIEKRQNKKTGEGLAEELNKGNI